MNTMRASDIVDNFDFDISQDASRFFLVDNDMIVGFSHNEPFEPMHGYVMVEDKVIAYDKTLKDAHDALCRIHPSVEGGAKTSLFPGKPHIHEAKDGLFYDFEHNGNYGTVFVNENAFRYKTGVELQDATDIMKMYFMEVEGAQGMEMVKGEGYTWEVFDTHGSSLDHSIPYCKDDIAATGGMMDYLQNQYRGWDTPVKDLGEYSDPMQHRGRQHKYMPHAVAPLAFEGKGNHAQRIEQASHQNKPQQRRTVEIKRRQKQQSAPAHQKIQRKMQRPAAAGAKGQHQRHTAQNYRPLHAKQHNSRRISQIDQKDRRKGSTNQQIDRRIIKSAAYPLGSGSTRQRVIQSAHQHHHRHTDAVKTGSHDLQPRFGVHQQDHHAGNRQQRSHAVADSIEDLLPQCQAGRLIFRPYHSLALHPPQLFYCHDLFHLQAPSSPTFPKSHNTVYKTILHYQLNLFN